LFDRESVNWTPLLPNVYLHLFDRAFFIYCQATGHKAHLVRYADDFVILTRGAVKETYDRVKQVLERMDLTLHEEKSRLLDARKESFDFLGFTFCRKKNFKRGKVITLVEPSRKSEQKFRDQVRDLTSRLTHCVGQDEVLKRVYRYVGGWVNYFTCTTPRMPFVGNAFS
jgi:hypothetical protein